MTRYRTIVADPPWPFQWNGGPGGRRARQTDLGYETMRYVDIRSLEVGDFPVRDVAAPDATLFLWSTQEALHDGEAARVARAWGFGKRVGEFIWRKPNFGAGAFPRVGHETCLIYKRGKGSLEADAPRNVHSVQTWSQPYKTNGGKTHSAKPDGFFDVVMSAHKGPFISLFERQERLGWGSFGDQSLSTAELPKQAA